MHKANLDAVVAGHDRANRDISIKSDENSSGCTANFAGRRLLLCSMADHQERLLPQRFDALKILWL